MSGNKRDRNGRTKGHHDEPKRGAPLKPVSRNEYTSMFEHFRDELDEHHDRRERIVKASRDITALSKKIIFSLQRVRKIEGDLPEDITQEVNTRLDEVSKLLAIIAPEIQGINRYRYGHSLRCLEELVEALTFAHYLKTQSLISVDELTSVTDDLARRAAVKDDEIVADAGQQESPPTVSITENDYVNGVFDLSGEMMRFATTTTALTGKLASASDEQKTPRTIVQDMQDLGSFFEMLPQQKTKTWTSKMEVMRASIAKVEKLGYGIAVRGNEREKGWVPDMRDEELVSGPLQ